MAIDLIELREWLEWQIKCNLEFADEFKVAEDNIRAKTGEYPNTMSTVHYQIAVSFQKCLGKIKELECKSSQSK